MVEAEENNHNAPVVFWFSGGPGGSSMIDFFENGPFSNEGDEFNSTSV